MKERRMMEVADGLVDGEQRPEVQRGAQRGEVDTGTRLRQSSRVAEPKGAAQSTTRSRSYARAYGPDVHLDAELAALRQMSSRARSAATRLTWQQAMARRTVRVREILRVAANAVRAPEPRRAKCDGRWFVVVEEAPVVSIVTRTPGRTLEQLGAPIAVHIHRPELVDVERLRELEVRGLVHVVAEDERR